MSTKANDSYTNIGVHKDVKAALDRARAKTGAPLRVYLDRLLRTELGRRGIPVGEER